MRARLAGWHEIGTAREPDRLLPRLTENEIALREAYALVTDAVTRGRPAHHPCGWERRWLRCS